ncbi:MAG: hypothetical protein KGH88_02625 [Thaumarchaeota archaeon]|nr:hypothetical protein [Nitrososphaerota archaeon]
MSRDGNTIISEDHAIMAGRKMHQTTKHVLTPPEIDYVHLLSGDAKGSHIITTYTTVPGGTKITVEGDFKLSRKS